ncbi:NADPH:quinone reductase [Acarospora aff. strigata]|nr:NADPH:quinone reductase [Acarospora aff. strigata]
MDTPQTMKGIWVEKAGGTEVLQYKTDLPVPEPKDGEILVKNDFCGVNYIDIYFRTGVYPSPKPEVLGREVSGTIVSTNGNVYGLKTGDRVVCLCASGYAEYTATSAKHACKIPDGINNETACAALLQGLTALTLIRESYEAKKGDWILVHAAAGGVGLWLCQLLKAVGAKVIGTASSEEKRKLALEHGAAHALESNADLAAKIKEITGGQGVAAVYDGVGKATFDTDLEVVGRKGNVICFGNASGPVEPLALHRLTPKSIKLLRPMLFTYIARRDEFEHYANELFDFILKEQPKVQIHATYALHDIAKTHEDLEGRRTAGKCLLKA